MDDGYGLTELGTDIHKLWFGFIVAKHVHNLISNVGDWSCFWAREPIAGTRVNYCINSNWLICRPLLGTQQQGVILNNSLITVGTQRTTHNYCFLFVSLFFVFLFFGMHAFRRSIVYVCAFFVVFAQFCIQQNERHLFHYYYRKLLRHFQSSCGICW